MGLSHRKRLRKYIEYYQNSFGFYEPFKQTPKSRQGGVLELIWGAFSKRIKLYVTPCILNELRSLGDDFQSTAAAAEEELSSHNCGHRDPISAADCLISCIKTSNPDHWWIATQDKKLREALSSAPAVPTMFLTYNGLYIETPSEATENALQNQTAETSGVPEWELQTKALKDLKHLSKNKSRSVFRRNRAQGPNPLSCLKKVRKDTSTLSEGVIKKKRPRRKPKTPETRD